jgi:dGTPase
VITPGDLDFFRTRMTHTLECAQIGRALARRTGANEALVEAACMAHDLGHPPFGHTGEEALNEVMYGNGGFEGNAQSFRFVTRLEAKVRSRSERPYGLNLSLGCLDAMLKYPWAQGEAPEEHYTKKFGYYAEDAEAFGQAHRPAAGKVRCFEASLMDWADDVAYAVHDLEDGIRAKLIPLQFLKEDEGERFAVAQRADDLFREPRFRRWQTDAKQEVLTRFLDRKRFFGWVDGPFDGSLKHKAKVKETSTKLIDYFITQAEPIRRDPNQNLLVANRVRLENRLLNAIVFRYVIDPPQLKTLQFGQKRMVKSLFDAFLRDRQLLPRSEHDVLEGAGDAHLPRVVCDYVSGMTDRYARRIYDRLYGGVEGSIGDIL